jgi:hypothetical protein
MRESRRGLPPTRSSSPKPHQRSPQARHRRGLIGTPETSHSENRRNIAEAATLTAAEAAS